MLFGNLNVRFLSNWWPVKNHQLYNTFTVAGILDRVDFRSCTQHYRHCIIFILKSMHRFNHNIDVRVLVTDSKQFAIRKLV